MISEYRHSYSSFALRRLAQTTSEIQIEKAKPPAWEPPKLLLVCGELNVVVVGSGVLLLLGSNVDCSGRSGKTKRGIKQRGVSSIPASLTSATKHYALYQQKEE